MFGFRYIGDSVQRTPPPPPVRKEEGVVDGESVGFEAGVRRRRWEERDGLSLCSSEKRSDGLSYPRSLCVCLLEHTERLRKHDAERSTTSTPTIWFGLVLSCATEQERTSTLHYRMADTSFDSIASLREQVGSWSAAGGEVPTLTAVMARVFTSSPNAGNSHGVVLRMSVICVFGAQQS